MYMCVHVRVYMCTFICMYMYTCVSVYMYAYTWIYVWVYICTRVGAFCLFVLSNPFTTCVCITGVFEHLHEWVGGNWKWGFFSACSWLALVAGVGGYILAGVEIGVLSCIFLYFCGC